MLSVGTFHLRNVDPISFLDLSTPIIALRLRSAPYRFRRKVALLYPAASQSACLGALDGVAVSHDLFGLLRCAERRYCWFHLRNVDIVSFLVLSTPIITLRLRCTHGRFRRDPVGVLRFIDASHRSTHDLRLVGYAARTCYFDVVTITKPQASRGASVRCTAVRPVTVYSAWYGMLSVGTFHLRNVDPISFLDLSTPITALRLRSAAYRFRRKVALLYPAASQLACFGAFDGVAVSHDLFGLLRFIEARPSRSAHDLRLVGYAKPKASPRASIYQRQQSPCAYDLHIVDYTATGSACLGAPSTMETVKKTHVSIPYTEDN
ncbi:hypothetical protein C8R43DRAFT_1141847 [Mycena crocata]|nr:hypothetical protein C8R43DRAFT_1141847 [Mycena crocata]